MRDGGPGIARRVEVMELDKLAFGRVVHGEPVQRSRELPVLNVHHLPGEFELTDDTSPHLPR